MNTAGWICAAVVLASAAILAYALWEAWAQRGEGEHCDAMDTNPLPDGDERRHLNPDKLKDSP